MRSKTLTTSEFKRLPKYKKRIMIAKDVIAQLNTKQLIAKTRSYVSLPKKLKNNIDMSLDVKTNYNQIQNCKVCALGACMMSATKFGNMLTFDDLEINTMWLGSSSVTEPVTKLFNSIFDAKQLLLIETCFEGVSNDATRYAKDAMGADLTDEETKTCRAYYKKHKGKADPRLRAIMNNIIRNKGTFKP